MSLGLRVSRSQLIQGVTNPAFGFIQRRKTILNNLRHAPENLRARVEAAGGASGVLERASLNPPRRAEKLALAEWARVADQLC